MPLLPATSTSGASAFDALGALGEPVAMAAHWWQQPPTMVVALLGLTAILLWLNSRKPSEAHR